MTALAIVWLVIVQVLQLAAAVVGWFVLAPACYFHAWGPATAQSIKPGHGPVDRWTWPINFVFGNPEDGVSGLQALVWVNGVQVPYYPTASAGWRAYCWSAWRNSCDNLKYVFAWAGGPLVTGTYTLFGKQHTYRLGWQPENGYNVPVLSLW